MPRSLRHFTLSIHAPALAALGAVLGIASLPACVDPTPDRDGGMTPDTSLTEGGIIREDTGPRYDAPGSDAPTSDAGADICTGSCDPRSDGTCLDGMRCVLAGEVPVCSDAPGEASAGMPCETTTACATGLACFRAARTSGGVCAQVCCPSDPAGCDAIARCGGDGVLVDGTETTWGRCVLPRTCDVLAPELTCEAREGCYVVDGTGVTECRLAGSAEAGASCTYPEDCAAGLFCGGLTERTCLRICSIAMPRTCTSDERCIAQTYSPEGTGICVVAAGIR